jgi:hypothetical protein
MAYMSAGMLVHRPCARLIHFESDSNISPLEKHYHPFCRAGNESSWITSPSGHGRSLLAYHADKAGAAGDGSEVVAHTGNGELIEGTRPVCRLSSKKSEMEEEEE